MLQEIVILLILGLLNLVQTSPILNQTHVQRTEQSIPMLRTFDDPSPVLGVRNPNKKKAPKPATDQQMQIAASKGCELLYLLTADEDHALARMRKKTVGNAHLTSSQSQWTNVDDMATFGWSETFGDPKWTYLGIDEVLKTLSITRDDPGKGKGKGKGKGLKPGSSKGPKQASPLFGAVPQTRSFNAVLKQAKKVKVDGKKYTPSDGEYDQVIYPEAGMIIPYYVYSPAYEAARLKVEGSIVPLARYSDVLALEYARLCGDSIKTSGFKYYMAANVENSDMWAMALKALQNRNNKAGTLFPDWPGVTFDMSTDEGKALLASPIAQSMAYMLIQHKKMFGMKTVSKVTIFKNQGATNMDENQPYPTLLFETVDASVEHCGNEDQCCCPK